MSHAMMMRQVIVYPDLEDGGWVAEVPSLPGCISQGDAKETAIGRVAQSHIESIPSRIFSSSN